MVHLLLILGLFMMVIIGMGVVKLEGSRNARRSLGELWKGFLGGLMKFVNLCFDTKVGINDESLL